VNGNIYGLYPTTVPQLLLILGMYFEGLTSNKPLNMAQKPIPCGKCCMWHMFHGLKFQVFYPEKKIEEMCNVNPS
jgi:hypothetical protein